MAADTAATELATFLEELGYFDIASSIRDGLGAEEVACKVNGEDLEYIYSNIRTRECAEDCYECVFYSALQDKRENDSSTSESEDSEEDDDEETEKVDNADIEVIKTQFQGLIHKNLSHDQMVDVLATIMTYIELKNKGEIARTLEKFANLLVSNTSSPTAHAL